jgi:glycolate oxidase iron-sulfur subunit
METESPRGRIHLARALAEGRVTATAAVATHFDLCLQCRACETACPSGVPYGRIMEGARALVQSKRERPLSWRLRTLLLRLLLASPRRIAIGFAVLRVYQRSSLAQLARRFLPGRLREMEAMLPPVARRPFILSQVPSSAPSPNGRAALLTGCVMPYLYPDTHAATVRVLARNGFAVLAPAGQVCCGALHLHNGDVAAARRLAMRNIDAFLAAEPDAIVVNSAGCGSTMKEYVELLQDDAAWKERAARLSSLVRDVSELLAERGFEAPERQVEGRVTYQDSCHLAHAQRIRDAPRALLRSVPGLELAEMSTPDRCCGSAGIYNLTQPAMARRLLDEKMADISSTGCNIIATANPGCMLQLAAGVRASGGAQEVVHVVDLLDRAYGGHAAEPRPR